MSFYKFSEDKLIKFAKSENAAAIVAMGIAAAKGVFRPMLTMMDKHEKPETKRYTATRECLTELIAIPVYFTSGIISKFLATKLANPKYFLEKAGSKEIAEKLAKENLPKLKSTLGCIGVCISALFLIPYICSKAINPIMKIITPKTNKKSIDINNRYENLYRPQQQINNKIFKPFVVNNSSGMKVGGL